MKKGNKKICLIGIFLVVAIIEIIFLMGIITLNYSKISKLQNEINSLEINLLNSENEYKYISSLNKSITEKLNNSDSNSIRTSIYNTGYIDVNSKHEAYITIFEDGKNSQFYQIASNVIKAWFCKNGDEGLKNSFILFLKEDGSVTYEKFDLESDVVGVTEESVLQDVYNVVDVLYGSSGEVILIKEDGTYVDNLYDLISFSTETTYELDIDGELVEYLYGYVLKSDNFTGNFAVSNNVEPASFYRDSITTYSSISDMEKLLDVLSNYNEYETQKTNENQISYSAYNTKINKFLEDDIDNVCVYCNINNKMKHIFNQEIENWEELKEDYDGLRLLFAKRK